MSSRKDKVAIIMAAERAKQKTQLHLLNMRSQRVNKTVLEKLKREIEICKMRVFYYYCKMASAALQPVWAYPRTGSYWENIVPTMSDETFKESFRMHRATFEILCFKLKKFAKVDTTYRKCIPLQKRVAIGIYALQSSTEYEAIGRLFGVSKSSVCNILIPFCQQVWNILGPKYLKSAFINEEQLKECIKGFEELGFPQCFGAIDACHIVVRPPAQDSTSYLNSNGCYSTVLLALVDYRNRFLYINAGCPGRCSDSEVFENSKLKVALSSPIFENMNRTLCGVKVPVGIIGDSAFRFSANLMKPYPFKFEPPASENGFNGALSEARRAVENAFVQVKARFTRIGKGIDNEIKNVPLIIHAACVLHNFLNCHNDNIENNWLQQQADFERRHEQPHEDDLTADLDPEPNAIRDAIAQFLDMPQTNLNLKV